MADALQWSTDFRLINNPNLHRNRRGRNTVRQVITVGESSAVGDDDGGGSGSHARTGPPRLEARYAEAVPRRDAMVDLTETMATEPLKKTPICFHLEQVRGHMGLGVVIGVR